MDECYLTFRSVTPAMEALRRIRQAGIFCTLLRTPGTLGKGGCGYSIRLRPRDLARSCSLLERKAWEGAFCRREGGPWEEAAV